MAIETQLKESGPANPGQPLWSDWLAGIMAQGRVRWTTMLPAQRKWALVAGGLLAGLIGGLMWYGLRTDWRTLYAYLDQEDARQTAQILTQAQIPFETTADGAGIRVPADQLDKARLANLPREPKTADVMRLTAEEALEEKLVSTLEPVSGSGNVRASVTLDYDAAATEETQETYDPDQTVTLQRTEQTTGPEPVAARVPGTASNAPNTRAVYPRQTSPLQTAKTESETYGVSKTVRRVMENPGRVRRLTAAVVVNDRLLQLAAKGKAAVWQPRSADELRNLTALAQAAVGFDAARGDLLTVQDLAFEDNRMQQPVSLGGQVLATAENSPVWIRYAALMAGLFGVLAFGVRPALRRSRSASPVLSQGAARDLAAGRAAEPHPALKLTEMVELDPERVRAQEIFERVSEHLKLEPTHSSRLLQSWIHSD